MDQLIRASLSHTHYWYEVGMLKDCTRYNTVLYTVLLLSMLFYSSLMKKMRVQVLLLIQYSVCVCFLPIHSGRHQDRWTYQPGSHRRKVTQDFSSTFFLRCVPSFFSREGFSLSLPSSTVKSNFVYLRFNRSPPVGHFCFYFFTFLVRKSRLPGSNSRPNVSEGYMVTSELPGRPTYSTVLLLILVRVSLFRPVLSFRVLSSRLLGSSPAPSFERLFFVIILYEETTSKQTGLNGVPDRFGRHHQSA